MSNERLDESWVVKKSFIESLIENLKKKNIKDETVLYDEYSYEVLVKFETSRPIVFRFFFEEDGFVQEDTANNVTYELSTPTNEFLLFIMRALKESVYINDIPRLFPIRHYNERFKELDFLEFLKKIILPRAYTLKIQSQEPKSSNEFSKLVTAFLFNLSYNLDIAIIEVRFLHELTRYRFGRMKRAKPDDIEPPRRFYNPDLVYHYQMAISTDSIPLQFLSFYHVIEHFFYDVYHEELINAIRSKITRPDFSYKRNRDIDRLIKLIVKKVQYKDQHMSYNEQEALYLTLAKYVKLDNLINRLNMYDESLISYYVKNKVPFSQGSSVDFGIASADEGRVLKQIADRIYKTRNSIVHSKEGGKPKYTPFKDDRSLLLEIPLLRFIAEELIINTADIIK